MVRFLIHLSLVLAVWSVTALPAFAQETGPATGTATGRVYRGLFGSGLQAGTNQSLTINGSLGGGLDTNVMTAEPSVALDPATRTTASGSFGRVSMGLGYNAKLAGIDLQARGDGVVSHYSTRLEPLVKTYRGEVGASAPVWSGGTLAGNYGISFRPFYYLPWLVGAANAEAIQGPAPPIDETAGAIVEYHTYSNTAASFIQRLPHRSTMNLSYGYQNSDSGSGQRDYRGRYSSAGITFGLTRGLGLRVGYSVSHAGYSGQQSYTARNLNGGLNFSKALSLTRSTTLMFNTGSSGTVDRGRTYYRLDAHVTLTHEFGRTWTGQVIYNRNVSFDDTFRVPVPMDAGTIGVRGMFSRRLEFHSQAGSVNGALGFGVGANGFNTYYASTGLLYGLSKILGLGVDYTYFTYRFDGQGGLPPGLVRRADRQHLLGFVTMRTAIFKGRNRGSR